MAEVARQLKTFSGREISKLFTGLQTHICANMGSGAVRTKNLRLTKQTLLDVVKTKVEEHNRTLDVLARGYAYVHKEGSPALPGTPAGNSGLGLSSSNYQVKKTPSLGSSRVDLMRANLGEHYNPANININISNNNLQHENTIGLLQQQQPSKPGSEIPSAAEQVYASNSNNNLCDVAKGGPDNMPKSKSDDEGRRKNSGTLADIFGMAPPSSTPSMAPPTGTPKASASSVTNGTSVSGSSTSNQQSNIEKEQVQHFTIGSPSDPSGSPRKEIPVPTQADPWLQSPDKTAVEKVGETSGAATGSDNVRASAAESELPSSEGSIPNATVNPGMPSIYDATPTNNSTAKKLPSQGFNMGGRPAAKRKPKDTIASPFRKPEDVVYDL